MPDILIAMSDELYTHGRRELPRPKTIKLTPVTSSQIKAIGHDEASSTLAVQFPDRNGEPSIYHYQNVDRILYVEFASSVSIGSFFYARIKGNPAYPYKKQ